MNKEIRIKNSEWNKEYRMKNFGIRSLGIRITNLRIPRQIIRTRESPFKGGISDLDTVTMPKSGDTAGDVKMNSVFQKSLIIYYQLLIEIIIFKNNSNKRE